MFKVVGHLPPSVCSTGSPVIRAAPVVASCAITKAALRFWSIVMHAFKTFSFALEIHCKYLIS